MDRKRYITGKMLRVEGMMPLKTQEGENIETKVRRITENGEPIKDGAPMVFTEKKDGVRPEYNIRTDKWELVLDKMEAGNRQKQKIARGWNVETNKEKETADGGESGKNDSST